MARRPLLPANDPGPVPVAMPPTPIRLDGHYDDSAAPGPVDTDTVIAPVPAPMALAPAPAPLPVAPAPPPDPGLGHVANAVPQRGLQAIDPDDQLAAEVHHDWREWIVPPSDNRGHSEKVYLRVQPAMFRQMELAMNRGLPYRNISDLMRHALVRHLAWLVRQRGNIPSVMAQVDAMLELTRDAELLAQQEEVLAALASSAERAVSQGDQYSLRRILTVANASIDAMPPGSWRDSYRQKFHERFTPYAKITGEP